MIVWLGRDASANEEATLIGKLATSGVHLSPPAYWAAGAGIAAGPRPPEGEHTMR
jgi:hypothetical protein